MPVDLRTYWTWSKLESSVCHTTFLSTTCAPDFRGINDKHFHLFPLTEVDDQVPARCLQFPYRWSLECRYGGCSCHFRNWVKENPPEFWEPQDWFEEDPEDIEATQAFYDFMESLVGRGERLDIVTVWSGDDLFGELEVSLSVVSRAAFRFMDGYRFIVVP
jgi:hypothetical protein